MSYFFSQPDADDEPTIWLETGETNAIPMLRKVSIGTNLTTDEDDARLWDLIEKAVGTTDAAGMTDPAALAWSPPVPSARERALQLAEAYIAETSPPRRQIENGSGEVVRVIEVGLEYAERLGLVLRTARFLLGEEE